MVVSTFVPSAYPYSRYIVLNIIVFGLIYLISQGIKNSPYMTSSIFAYLKKS